MADLCNMLLYFMLVLLLPTLATSQAYLNVSLGSYLIADNNNSTWSSPSGDFAFGLRRMPGGGYLLAIWFNNKPERTIVWSANRDDLAEEGSKVQLFADGRFELDDPSGQQIWNLGVGRTARVAYCAMLDTGNFVLAGDSSAVLWQTFDEPSDTMLPTQMLNQGVSLVSSFSETNLSSGRFVQCRMCGCVVFGIVLKMTNNRKKNLLRLVLNTISLRSFCPALGADRIWQTSPKIQQQQTCDNSTINHKF